MSRQQDAEVMNGGEIESSVLCSFAQPSVSMKTFADDVSVLHNLDSMSTCRRQQQPAAPQKKNAQHPTSVTLSRPRTCVQ
jgi:hypothetical protein